MVVLGPIRVMTTSQLPSATHHPLPNHHPQDSGETDALAASVGRAGARVERDSTSSRVQCPQSDGFNFKIRPQANVQPAKEMGVGGRSGSEKKQRLYVDVDVDRTTPCRLAGWPCRLPRN